MNFELDSDQLALQDAVSRFLKDSYGLEQRRKLMQRPFGEVSSMWGALAEMGLPGLLVPESHGGAGRSVVDACVVQEELGKALVAEPFWMSAVAGVMCLNLAADEAQKARFFPRVVSGEWPLAVVSPWVQAENPQRTPSVRARRTGGNWCLTGEMSAVPGADALTALVVHAESEGDGGQRLFLVEPGQRGMGFNRYKCHDGTRGADLVFDDVVVELKNCLQALPTTKFLGIARDYAIAGLCSEAVGAMSAVFDLTLEYIRTRKQFGVSLSSFQVLQHRSVEMLVELERARSMAILASVAAAQESAQRREVQLAAAKIQICRSARFVGQQAIQLHGGMGMTDEYAAGHYFRRLTAIEILLGNQDQHISTLVAQGGLFAEPA